MGGRPFSPHKLKMLTSLQRSHILTMIRVCILGLTGPKQEVGLTGPMQGVGLTGSKWGSSKQWA